MREGYLSHGRADGKPKRVSEEESLDRAMVAGLLLEVILEAPALPSAPQARQRQIKSKLTHSLVTHLAGRITLDRFRTLIDRLEQWFPFYYPLMPPPGPQEQRACPKEAGEPPAAGLVRHDLVKEWLEEVGGKILPQRPQRKVQPDRLGEFMRRTRGRWFQAKVFAQDFDIDRKTAWEYLQKLQEAGLLVHNGGRSAAVRYRLADRFLRVKLLPLEQQVAQTLAGEPRPQRDQVVEWLAASAGEPFWEDSWPIRAADRREEIINALKTAAVLEVVCQSGERRMLRLLRRWLEPA